MSVEVKATLEEDFEEYEKAAASLYNITMEHFAEKHGAERVAEFMKKRGVEQMEEGLKLMDEIGLYKNSMCSETFN